MMKFPFAAPNGLILASCVLGAIAIGLQLMRPPAEVEVRGEIFVAARSGENFRLGSVKVRAYTLKNFRKILARHAQEADAEIALIAESAKSNQDEFDAWFANFRKAMEVKIDAYGKGKSRFDDEEKVRQSRIAELKERQHSMGTSQKWEDSISETRELIQLQQESSTAIQKIQLDFSILDYEGASGIDEKKKELAAKQDELEGKKTLASSTKALFGRFPSTNIMTYTDSEGRFALKCPSVEKFVIVAQADRTAGFVREEYFWVIPQPRKGEMALTLSNYNLAPSQVEGLRSVIAVAD